MIYDCKNLRINAAIVVYNRHILALYMCDTFCHITRTPCAVIADPWGAQFGKP